MYIRKDDVVEVVAGDDKGPRGKVLKVLHHVAQLLPSLDQRLGSVGG